MNSSFSFQEECQYGRFDFEAREYVITARNTPRPWLNYIWNREFLSLVSQTGQGYGFHQDERSLRTNIVAGRAAYVQDVDSGDTWSAEGMDSAVEPDEFTCRHGLGYTVISQRRGDIVSHFRIFIPDGASAEAWTITLRNSGAKTRRLRIVAVLDTRLDGDVGFQGYYTRAATWYDSDLKALIHLTRPQGDDNPRRAFLSTTSTVTGCDCRYDSFFGPYSRDTFPRAIRDGRMGMTDRCEFEKCVFALETRVDLEPGASHAVQFFAGHYRAPEDIGQLGRRFAGIADVDAAFAATRGRGVSFPQALEIRVGDRVFDAWCNTWLKQQLAYNATWARDYFNGYRDLCQDVENLVVLDPDRARAKLRQILSFQYPSGYAPRAWMNGKALDHGHGDSPVWITYAVRALVLETGDLKLLDEVVPYYEKDEGTVYDHCRRAIDWYWRDRGANGLCLFRKGDWNDAMVRVGWHGKGTSVWTTMAYHRALIEFAELARMIGKHEDAGVAVERAAEIRRRVNDVGWDGEYYIYGFTDAGEPVGSHRNREGTLHANAQSWAIISGVADGDRARRCMAALDRHLDGDTGVLAIKDPYTEFDINIGPITGQRPGAYQNQSVYCHSNTFKIMADCLLGRSEQAWRGIEKILPFSGDRKLIWGEPYVIPNCYFGPAAGYRHDQPGQSWMTATAGWLLRILAQRILGLQPTLEGLRVAPCLPEKIRDCSVTRAFRGATYHIRYLRGPGSGTQLVVEGKGLEGRVLPHQAGRTYDVEVRLGAGAERQRKDS
jgi:cellobiose phosphorylase